MAVGIKKLTRGRNGFQSRLGQHVLELLQNEFKPRLEVCNRLTFRNLKTPFEYVQNRKQLAKKVGKGIVGNYRLGASTEKVLLCPLGPLAEVLEFGLKSEQPLIKRLVFSLEPGLRAPSVMLRECKGPLDRCFFPGLAGGLRRGSLR